MTSPAQNKRTAPLSLQESMKVEAGLIAVDKPASSHDWDTASVHSTEPLLGKNATTATGGSKAKALWMQLKEEDEERKRENVEYVSEEAATAITGHGKGGARSTSGEGKGDGRAIAAFGLF